MQSEPETVMPFYEGFERLQIDTSGGATINLVREATARPCCCFTVTPSPT